MRTFMNKTKIIYFALALVFIVSVVCSTMTYDDYLPLLIAKISLGLFSCVFFVTIIRIFKRYDSK